MLSFLNELNIVCCQTKLDNIAHEQAIICRQLYAGYVMNFQPMKMKENLQQMITTIHCASENIFRLVPSSYNVNERITSTLTSLFTVRSCVSVWGAILDIIANL